MCGVGKERGGRSRVEIRGGGVDLMVNRWGLGGHFDLINEGC